MRPWVADVGLAALALAAAAARLAAAPVLPADRAPDTLAYAMVAGMAVALLLRRRLAALVRLRAAAVAIGVLVVLGGLAFPLRRITRDR